MKNEFNFNFSPGGPGITTNARERIIVRVNSKDIEPFEICRIEDENKNTYQILRNENGELSLNKE